MKFPKYFTAQHALLAALPLIALTSCLPDEEVTDWKPWYTRNQAYVTRIADSVADGKKVFSRITPQWAPQAYVYMKWHNDTMLTRKNLKPLDNSTMVMKYELYDIDGTKIQTSYKTNGDSTYTSRPSQNIIGFWTAATHMHVGDSVTVVIPANAGYGAVQTNSVKPYSTLIYNLKLVKITNYEIP